MDYGAYGRESIICCCFVSRYIYNGKSWTEYNGGISLDLGYHHVDHLQNSLLGLMVVCKRLSFNVLTSPSLSTGVRHQVIIISWYSPRIDPGHSTRVAFDNVSYPQSRTLRTSSSPSTRIIIQARVYRQWCRWTWGPGVLLEQGINTTLCYWMSRALAVIRLGFIWMQPVDWYWNPNDAK